MSPKQSVSLTVEWSLLGFLRERSMHGYEIYRKLLEGDGVGLVWRLKQGQLYALLAKMEGRGYVSYVVAVQPSRPPRKVYSLTDAGCAALLAWVQSPVRHGRAFRMEFLAKLYFARQEGPSVLRRLLSQQRELCETWLTERPSDEGEPQPYVFLVHAFREGQIQAILTWLGVCEQTLLGNT